MEFNQLSEVAQVKVVKVMLDEEISFQMEDAHAFYFDAPADSEMVEYKVTKESTALYAKYKGSEDWNWCFSIEDEDLEGLI
jgi:hypothetical protein